MYSKIIRVDRMWNFQTYDHLVVIIWMFNSYSIYSRMTV